MFEEVDKFESSFLRLVEHYLVMGDDFIVLIDLVVLVGLVVLGGLVQMLSSLKRLIVFSTESGTPCPGESTPTLLPYCSLHTTIKKSNVMICI